jgi:hypothetical protein
LLDRRQREGPQPTLVGLQRLGPAQGELADLQVLVGQGQLEHAQPSGLVQHGREVDARRPARAQVELAQAEHALRALARRAGQHLGREQARVGGQDLGHGLRTVGLGPAQVRLVVECEVAEGVVLQVPEGALLNRRRGVGRREVQDFERVHVAAVEHERLEGLLLDWDREVRPERGEERQHLVGRLLGELLRHCEAMTPVVGTLLVACEPVGERLLEGGSRRPRGHGRSRSPVAARSRRRRARPRSRSVVPVRLRRLEGRPHRAGAPSAHRRARTIQRQPAGAERREERHRAEHTCLGHERTSEGERERHRRARGGGRRSEARRAQHLAAHRGEPARRQSEQRRGRETRRE